MKVGPNRTGRIDFDGPSKILGTNPLIHIEWPSRAEPTISMIIVRNWLGSESILWDKVTPYGSDIADPRQSQKKEIKSTINSLTIFGRAKYG